MLYISFRNAFCAGLLLAALTGVYLSQLWPAEKQVRLHSEHFLHAIEQKDWTGVGAFVDADYKDQWGQDRPAVAARLGNALRYVQNLQIHHDESAIRVEGNAGTWRGRISLEAEPSELSAIVKERVNTLGSPFELRWREASGKPWDWKLVGVTNSELELPPDAY